MKKTKFNYNVERKWLVIDAKDKILGRLARQIAIILMGKNKPSYSAHILCGDNVIVINAKDIKVTGTKMKTKVYDKYTGFPSGRKEMNLETLMEKNPEKALFYAVKGMLPRNQLAKEMLRSLKIYADSQHPHVAQNPQTIEV